MNEDTVAQRLKSYIDYKQISSSQFADLCKIPRPSLSQILSGRNKKISNLLIGQIHDACPDLSIMWLLFEQGDMLVAENNNKPSDDEKNPDKKEKFPPIDKDDEKNSKENRLNTNANANHNSDNQSVIGLEEKLSFMRQIEKLKANPRKVTQITVYYDDSTFETFYPYKK